ncbi:MAG TPA: PAS-domain containing protein [Xanthobacteraceae bacterium]|nr:PAS-domain containing protein [Xanthobacteraceae bacterium]
MLELSNGLGILQDWRDLALLGALVLLLALGVKAALWRRHMLRTTATIDNMSQGLCVFDAAERLVVLNKRYLEIYAFSPDVVKPGCTLRDILRHRAALGMLSGDPEEYRKTLLKAVSEGRTTNSLVEVGNGRTISVINRPMPGGGWLGTHHDVTERRQLEKQRDALAVQESRRATIDAAIVSFREHMNALLESVGESARSMNSTATALTAASDQTSQRIESAVGASREASSSVKTAANAADELSHSIGEIGRQLEQTNAVVRVAVDETQATDEQIATLAVAAQKIGEVVKLIRDIAGQTNLLALNATIEAARAGESGKGFAVVASEVKSLAVQTAKATEDISGQISAVQASTSAAVEAIRRIAERMREINGYTSAVAASVEQQSAATGQISRNVANAARGTNVSAAVLDEVSTAASQTRNSAQTVLDASQSVETVVSDLRSEVETFLAKVAV